MCWARAVPKQSAGALYWSRFATGSTKGQRLRYNIAGKNTQKPNHIPKLVQLVHQTFRGGGGNLHWPNWYSLPWRSSNAPSWTRSRAPLAKKAWHETLPARRTPIRVHLPRIWGRLWGKDDWRRDSARRDRSNPRNSVKCPARRKGQSINQSIGRCFLIPRNVASINQSINQSLHYRHSYSCQPFCFNQSIKRTKEERHAAYRIFRYLRGKGSSYDSANLYSLHARLKRSTYISDRWRSDDIAGVMIHHREKGRQNDHLSQLWGHENHGGVGAFPKRPVFGSAKNNRKTRVIKNITGIPRKKDWKTIGLTGCRFCMWLDKAKPTKLRSWLNGKKSFSVLILMVQLVDLIFQKKAGRKNTDYYGQKEKKIAESRKVRVRIDNDKRSEARWNTIWRETVASHTCNRTDHSVVYDTRCSPLFHAKRCFISPHYLCTDSSPLKRRRALCTISACFCIFQKSLRHSCSNWIHCSRTEIWPAFFHFTLYTAT